MDYINVPTTVFAPIEYGCVGYTEEGAFDEFGEDNVNVYHISFEPLEWMLNKHGDRECYVKIICNKANEDRIIGFHLLSPFAAEVVTGVGIAIKCNPTKHQFD